MADDQCRTCPRACARAPRAGYFAPEPPPIRPTIEFTVQDSGRSYVDVTAEDIDVLEDDVPQKIDTFQEAVDPVSIVMALDASGSMKKSTELVKSHGQRLRRARCGRKTAWR